MDVQGGQKVGSLRLKTHSHSPNSVAIEGSCGEDVAVGCWCASGGDQGDSVVVGGNPLTAGAGLPPDCVLFSVVALTLVWCLSSVLVLRLGQWLPRHYRRLPLLGLGGLRLRVRDFSLIFLGTDVWNRDFLWRSAQQGSQGSPTSAGTLGFPGNGPQLRVAQPTKDFGLPAPTPPQALQE